MRVRLATTADTTVLKSLERATDTAAHWSDNAYTRLFTAEPPRIVLIAEAEQVEAFLVGKVIGADAEVENIVVSEKSRRQGLGLLLLRRFLEEGGRRGVRRIFLEVRESNDAARMLYKTFGFRESGRRPKYYCDPVEDAVLYEIAVPETA